MNFIADNAERKKSFCVSRIKMKKCLYLINATMTLDSSTVEEEQDIKNTVHYNAKNGEILIDQVEFDNNEHKYTLNVYAELDQIKDIATTFPDLIISVERGIRITNKEEVDYVETLKQECISIIEETE